MNKELIIFRGKKGSGKDTAASITNAILTLKYKNPKVAANMKYLDYLLNERDTSNIFHFADGIKDCISSIFNIRRQFLDNNFIKDSCYYSFKNRVITTQNVVEQLKNNSDTIVINNIDEYKSILVNGNISSLFTGGINVLISIRFLMQYFGTELIRNIFGDNIWVNKTIDKINDHFILNDFAIIADMRFKNEYDEIIKYCKNECINYRVFYMVRNTNEIIDNHDSEQMFELDCTQQDIINNVSSLDELFYTIKHLLKL